jgi:NAD+ synthase
MSLADDVAAWIRTTVHEAKAEGVVIGLSGGIDSAVAAALAQRALLGHVLGAILPCESDPLDAELARLVASTLNIETIELDLTAPYRALMALLPDGPPVAKANAKPRLRMIALYYLAASRKYLVCGASNRSELSIGYFTKHGDGAADLLPMGNFLKFEVRQLARELRIPQRIIDRAPTAGLWPGQTDEGEMGMSYGQLDTALRAMDHKDFTAVPGLVISRVRQMMQASAHKRALAPIFRPRSRAGGPPPLPNP